MERDLAVRAGLGFIGKNTLLINEQLGSGGFLAELLTTLPLPPDPPRKKTGGCVRCIVFFGGQGGFGG
jgi:epoxyqueuosine reductase